MKKVQKYFAAANGFNGFKSYFDKVFSPYELDRIYILKGGPGTGKSSFMKKIANEFSEKNEVELIYCSSDTHSLDGVIISSDKARIAILDGTAPHATDPHLPGVVESIINLGEYWNEKTLINSKENIKIATKSKAKHYSLAYKYLMLAGKFDTLTEEIINEIYTVDDSEIICEILGSAISSEKSDIRLITSFSKDGFSSFPTLAEAARSIKYAVGIYGSEYLFMKHLKKITDAGRLLYTDFPTPLDENKTEAIYFPKSEFAICTENKKTLDTELVIDTSRFIDIHLLSKRRDALEFLWRERELMLWNATDEFKKASDAHFELEKIYTSSMNFEKIDEINQEYVKEIREFLN